MVIKHYVESKKVVCNVLKESVIHLGGPKSNTQDNQVNSWINFSYTIFYIYIQSYKRAPTIKRVPTPYFWPSFLYTVKVYLNKCLE